LSAPSPAADTAPSEAQVLELLEGLVRDIVGEDYALGIELDMDTSFAEDLELESIEFVRLGEKLQEHYGEKVDLVAWFAEFDVDQIINLTVGELVDFIRRSVA
jgi:acyl carrier protein